MDSTEQKEVVIMCNKDKYKQIINFDESGLGSEKENVPERQQNQTGRRKLKDGMLKLMLQSVLKKSCSIEKPSFP